MLTHGWGTRQVWPQRQTQEGATRSPGREALVGALSLVARTILPQLGMHGAPPWASRAPKTQAPERADFPQLCSFWWESP